MSRARSHQSDARCTAGRTKAACELLSQYLPDVLYAELLKQYEYVLSWFVAPYGLAFLCNSFAELDTHLLAIHAEQTAIEEFNAQAVPKPKKGKAPSQKKGDPAEKKRKAPARASNGVEKLKKANVKGMAKISSFFQKPA